MFELKPTNIKEFLYKNVKELYEIIEPAINDIENPKHTYTDLMMLHELNNLWTVNLQMTKHSLEKGRVVPIFMSHSPHYIKNDLGKHILENEYELDRDTLKANLYTILLDNMMSITKRMIMCTIDYSIYTEESFMEIKELPLNEIVFGMGRGDIKIAQIMSFKKIGFAEKNIDKEIDSFDRFRSYLNEHDELNVDDLLGAM